jgi:hypothetical protein
LGRNRPLAKDFENFAVTLATLVALAFIQLALRRLARASVVKKVGKSDGEGTSAGTRGNHKLAPIPVILDLIQLVPAMVAALIVGRLS